MEQELRELADAEESCNSWGLVRLLTTKHMWAPLGLICLLHLSQRIVSLDEVWLCTYQLQHQQSQIFTKWGIAIMYCLNALVAAPAVGYLHIRVNKKLKVNF